MKEGERKRERERERVCVSEKGYMNERERDYAIESMYKRERERELVSECTSERERERERGEGERYGEKIHTNKQNKRNSLKITSLHNSPLSHSLSYPDEH